MREILDKIAKRFSFSRLHVRLRALVCVAVIPMLSLIVFGSILYRHAKEAEIRDGAIALTNIAKNGLDRYIDSNQQLLATISHTDTIKEGNPSSVNAFFRLMHEQFPGRANFGAIDLKGNIFASILPMKEPVNISDRPWFQQVLKTRDFTIGDYQIGRITVLPVIVFAQPVFDSAGGIKFILFASMELKWLNRLWQDVKLPPDSHFLVTDRNGAVLFHYPDNENWVGKSVSEMPIVKAMRTRKNGAAESEGEDEVKRIYAFTTAGAPEGSIHIAVGISKKAAFTPINNILAISLILLAAITGLDILLAGIYSDRYIIKPINALQNAAERFLSGDYSTRANLKDGVDEIIAYSNVFDRLAEIIEQEIAGRKKTEALVKSILDAVDESFVIIDREFRIIFANRAYASTVKMPLEDIIGRHCYEVSHHFSKPCCESEGYPCTVNNVFETGEHGTAIHTHHDKEGNLVYLETKGYPLSKDAAGKVLTAIEIVIDITEKRKIEEQLRQAQKMEAVGRLAGGVAHDFNNMLAIINGYSELLLREVPVTDLIHATIQEINKAGQRSADITRQLLAFAGKQTIAPKALNINENIENMLKMLRRLLGENIELLWKPAISLWTVKMDTSQLDQILVNLFVNAHDAISGVGMVTIKTENLDLDKAPCVCEAHPDFIPGKYCCLSVSDNGHGMDKKTLEHAFDPFFTTKEPGKGTGLGLSIVFGIVKQNNAYIGIDSEPGKGATFNIYLPRYESKDAAGCQEPEKSEIFTGIETILLVEDDEPLLKLSKKQIEPLGYKVLSANSPALAIKLAEEHKGDIHLLMTDVMMPEMSGPELRDKIKSIHPAVKCLFVSGYTADIIARDGVLDEGIHFLQKPFSKEDLAKKIGEALS
jgi:PAS domain S-box-containing protein